MAGPMAKSHLVLLQLQLPLAVRTRPYRKKPDRLHEWWRARQIIPRREGEGMIVERFKLFQEVQAQAQIATSLRPGLK